MPQAVVAAALTTGVQVGASYLAGTALTFATVATTFASTLALTAAAQALSPKPKIGGIGTQSNTVTVRQPNATRKIVYGNTRVGGNIVFLEATNDNQYLHMVIVITTHEIEAFDAIYFDDEEITISGNNVTSPSRLSGYAKVYPVTKGTVANIPASLISETSWTSSHVLTDQAYIYVRLEYNADAFPSGLPNVSAVISGRKVYDTRSSTTAYSSNPAMIIRNYLMDDTYGLGATSAEINETSFVTAANICDETVSLTVGGTEKRYELDGVVDTGRTPRDNLEQMLTALNGALYYSNGQWSLRAGAYYTPTVTLDEDDLASGITIDTSVSARDSFNAVKGQFISPETLYQPTDYPEITSATFESEDGTERRYMDLQLPFTSSSSRAQRIAKQILYKSRQQITMSAKFKLSAFKFEVGDTVMITNSRMGFDQKVFEITSWQLNFSAEEVTVDCTLAETNSQVYSWDAEETAFVRDNTTLPSGLNPPTPTNLTLTATAVVNNDGITIPAIRVDWDVVLAGFVQYYEIQYKRLGNEEDYGSITVSHTETENYGSITDIYDADEDFGLVNEEILAPDDQYQSIIGTSNSFTIVPVLNGYNYNVRVRSINAFGARSAFVSATLASAGDTTAPNPPTNLAATGLYKSIDIRWTNPTDQDLDYIEIWENTVDNLNTANLIGTSGSSNFIRANLANNVTRYYWVRAVDLSSNKSDFSFGTNATTLLIEPNDFNDAVNNLFEEAGAFGIQPVSSLPASGEFDGQIVLLKTDLTLYRWDSATSSWDTELYTASSLTAGSITLPNFASGIEPIGIVNTLPTPSGYTGAKVVFLTTDNKLYRYNGTAWTSATSTQDLSGELGAGLFSDDLRPVERVTSLPTTDLQQGRVVVLTTDNKFYRYTGNAWTSDVAAADVTGQLNGSQISDGAITTTKISDDAITSPKVAANAITADSIAANAVTTGKIAAGAVSADQIAANAITAAKLAADSVEAGKIAAGAISASSLFVDGVIQSDAIATGAIVTNKIAASSIISSKIGAGAVTADKISVSELSAIAASLGTIQVGTANIANGAITSAKIADANITNAKIANAAVSSAKIANLAVDSLRITNGAVSTVENYFAASLVQTTNNTYTSLASDSITVPNGGSGSTCTLLLLFQASTNSNRDRSAYFYVNGVAQRELTYTRPDNGSEIITLIYLVSGLATNTTHTVSISATGRYDDGSGVDSGSWSSRALSTFAFVK